MQGGEGGKEEEEEEEEDPDEDEMSPEAVLVVFLLYVLIGSFGLWLGGKSSHLIESLYSTFLCLVALDFAGLAPRS